MNSEKSRHYLQLIERRMAELLAVKDPEAGRLFDAARYTALSGGKRLRPMLTLATTESLGGNIELALIPACAIEMVHTYSLIHDDLPCMDDDDYRRGQLTVHKKFDEPTAVLTGDFLLTYAFEILAEAPGLNAEQKIALIASLAKAAGGKGMIAGQMLDLEAENSSVSLESLKLIHRRKTGDILTAAIEFGAIIANTPPEHMQILQKFGGLVGLAYQIIDDVIDVTASEQKHGKKISSDAINGKTTYITLLGVEGSKDAAATLLNEGFESLLNVPFKTTALQSLAGTLVNRVF